MSLQRSKVFKHIIALAGLIFIIGAIGNISHKASIPYRIQSVMFPKVASANSKADKNTLWSNRYIGSTINTINKYYADVTPEVNYLTKEENSENYKPEDSYIAKGKTARSLEAINTILTEMEKEEGWSKSHYKFTEYYNYDLSQGSKGPRNKEYPKETWSALYIKWASDDLNDMESTVIKQNWNLSESHGNKSCDSNFSHINADIDNAVLKNGIRNPRGDKQPGKWLTALASTAREKRSNERKLRQLHKDFDNRNWHTKNSARRPNTKHINKDIVTLDKLCEESGHGNVFSIYRWTSSGKAYKIARHTYLKYNCYDYWSRHVDGVAEAGAENLLKDIEQYHNPNKPARHNNKNHHGHKGGKKGKGSNKGHSGKPGTKPTPKCRQFTNDYQYIDDSNNNKGHGENRQWTPILTDKLQHFNLLKKQSTSTEQQGQINDANKINFNGTDNDDPNFANEIGNSGYKTLDTTFSVSNGNNSYLTTLNPKLPHQRNTRPNQDSREQYTRPGYWFINLDNSKRRPTGRVSFYYRNAITIGNDSSKTYNIRLTINLNDSLRSQTGNYHNIAVSKNFGQGVYYDGMTRTNVSITAFGNRTHNPVTDSKHDKVSLRGDWISVNSLNGVEKGSHHGSYLPFLRHVHTNQKFRAYETGDQRGNYGEWSNYDTQSDDAGDNEHRHNAYTINLPINSTQLSHDQIYNQIWGAPRTRGMGHARPNSDNIGNIGNVIPRRGADLSDNALFNRNTVPYGHLNGGIAGSEFVDSGVTGQWFQEQYKKPYVKQTPSSWQSRYMNNFYKNSIWYKLQNPYGYENSFDMGSGRAEDAPGFNDTHSNACVSGSHGAWFSWSSVQTPVPDIKFKCIHNGSNEYIEVINRKDNTQIGNQIQVNRDNQGNINPQVTQQLNNLINEYNITLSPYALKVDPQLYQRYVKKESVQEDGGNGNKAEVEKDQFTTRGIKKWLPQVSCIIKAKIPKQPHKDIQKLHKQSTNRSTTTYDLKSANENFNYNLTNQLPNLRHPYFKAYDERPVHSTNGVASHTYMVKHFFISPNDNYEITDVLPKEVSLQSNDRNNDYNVTVTANGNRAPIGKSLYTVNKDNQGSQQKITVTLNRQALKKYSGDKFTVHIPVTASNLPKGIKKTGIYQFYNGSKIGTKTMNGEPGDPSTTATFTPNIYAGYAFHGNGIINRGKPQYPNKVKTIIPIIRTIVYKYNWDNPSNKDHQIFDLSSDAEGQNKLGSCFGNTLSRYNVAYYKSGFHQYTYSKYFNNPAILKKEVTYNYANTVFAEPDTVKKGKRGLYRTVYPMDGSSNPNDFNYSLYANNGNERLKFDSQENNLRQKQPGDVASYTNADANNNYLGNINYDTYNPDSQSPKSTYVPLKATPQNLITNNNQCISYNSGWDDNNYDTNDSDYTQKMYIPYIIPTVTPGCTPGSKACPVSPPKPPCNSSSSYCHSHPTTNPRYYHDLSARFVVDTDKTRHGLPFHLTTSMYNTMYNYSPTLFNQDFKDAKVKLTIENPNNGHVVYTATRYLLDMINNSGTTRDFQDKYNPFTRNQPYSSTSRWSHPEYPSGETNWNGYLDTKALKESGEIPSQPGHDYYRIDTEGNVNDKSQQGFPLKASLTLSSNPGNIAFPNSYMQTHAYTATRPKITYRKAGNAYFNTFNNNITSHNQRYNNIINSNNRSHPLTFNKQNSNSLSSTGINQNNIQFILPERTVAYGTDSENDTDNGTNKPYERNSSSNNNDTDNTAVRDIDEELDWQQPKIQEAKAGYGITGNDMKMTYYGHIDPHGYMQNGSGLIAAYPQDFNAKDSNIGDSDDPFGHKISSNDNANQNFMNQNLSDGSRHGHKSLWATPMIHQNSSYDHNQNHDGDVNSNNGDNGDNAILRGLDSDNDTAQDNYIDHLFDNMNSYYDGQLNTGTITTSYGYIPKVVQPMSGIVSNKQVLSIRQTSNHNPFDDYSHLDDDIRSTPYWKSNGTYVMRSMRHNGSISNVESSNNKELNNSITIPNEKHQSDRLFLQQFLHTGKYPMLMESNFYNGNSVRQFEYNRRLGGNFFRIDDGDPLYVYAHEYITRNESKKAQAFDEFSPQPILTNPNGISQTPQEYPQIPSDIWRNNNDWNWLP